MVIRIPKYKSKTVNKVVDFLRIFRAHTTPATMLMIIPFYSLGGGNILSWHGLFLVLWSILVHWSGYGGNSVSDAFAGYDQQDKNKQHFPLVAGRIKISTAVKVLQTMLLLASVSGALLILFGNGDKVLSLTMLLIAITAGFNYNSGINKVTSLKFLYLTLFAVALVASCYYMMFNPINSIFDVFLFIPRFMKLIPSYSYSTINTIFIFGLFYCVFGAFYQIGWLGELKEIEHPTEVNLLVLLGAKIDEDGVFNPDKSRLFGDITKLLQLASAFCIVIILCNLIASIVFVIFSTCIMYFHSKMVRKDVWVRNSVLENSAKEEIFVLFLLPLLLASVVGWNLIIPLIAFSLIWFVTFNKLLWNTILRPQV